jgi:hypothetical protein
MYALHYIFYPTGFRGFRHGIARSSKEVTFDKIRREINDRGHQLRYVHIPSVLQQLLLYAML